MSHHTTRRNHRFIDLVGKRFNRWLVISEAPKPEHLKTKQRVVYWLCRCDCGNTGIVAGQSLRTGASQSCGCRQRECPELQNRTHGLSGTIEYTIWQGIKARCYNPAEPAYRNYGGRGITMCDRWRNSFENFLADMGLRPSLQHSIDRIDCNIGYSPDNCRWATAVEQANNTRKNRFVAHDGQNLTIAQWSRITGIQYHTLGVRVRKGYAPEDVFFRGNLKAKWRNKRAT